MIDSLPEEIIILIFELVIAEDESYGARTSLALISKGFHAVVYNTPSFWTKISTANSPAVNTLALARSMDLPLDINLTLETEGQSISEISSMDEVFRAACAHLSRWRSATVEIGSDTALVQLLRGPAPRMEAICIQRPIYEESDCFIELFDGQADRLTSVRLTNICVPWNTAMLSGLRVLELESTGTPPPTVEEFMAILAASPLLSSLKLESVTFPSPLPPSVPLSVHLPQLRTLHLSCARPLIMEYLLEHIHPGPSSCVDFTAFLKIDGNVNPSHFIPTLSPLIPPIIHPSGPATLMASFYRLAYYVWSIDGRRVRIKIEPVRRPLILSLLLDTLPREFLRMDTIVSISLVVSDLGRVSPFFTLLNGVRVTALRLVHVYGTSALDTVLEFLARTEELEGKHTPCFFPALQELDVALYQASPGALGRVVRNRCADSPDGLILLRVTRARPRHKSDYEVAEAVAGLQVIWEWEGSGE